MQKRRVTLGMLLCLVIVLGLSACAPTTFVQTMDPGWNTIELKEGLSYEESWRSIVDLLAQKFDLEILAKEDGYIRTGWLHSWTGDLTENYKVRAIIKYSPDHKSVAIKSEAQYYSRGLIGLGSGWEMGTDDRLITTLRTDIMGKIGRVTR